MDERYTNLPYQRAIRRDLRQHATPAERRLWQMVRTRRLGGFRFRRQHGVARYVLDFYCAEARLGVELDGSVHGDPLRAEYDRTRQQSLESLGIRIVRVTNREVMVTPDIVAAALLQMLQGER